MEPDKQSWAGCLFALIGVLLGQLGLASQLFGPHPTHTLGNDQPILNGRHPLHLYHGSLGVSTFRERWSTTCYDPAFQAGYPKTPVFDDGSRPAELFLSLANQAYSPSAYKLGLFMLCGLVPMAFALAAWGCRLTPSGVALAAGLGCLLWWTSPVRSLLDAGNLDHLLAGLMALIFLGSLVRYSDFPGIHSWLLMAYSVALGWFAHPVLWFGLVPLGAAYYLAVAPKHGLGWHLGLVGVAITGLAPNLWWLTDWLQFWWIRQPSIDEIVQLPHWSRVLGEAQQYTEFLGPGPFGAVVLILGLLGMLHLLRVGKNLAAMLLVLGVLLTVLVVRLGDTWPALQMILVNRVAPFGVALLILPAAGMIGHWWDSCRAGRLALFFSVIFLVLLGWFPTLVSHRVQWLQLDHKPLHIGLTPFQREWLGLLREETDTTARILIEENDPDRPNWNWTALLPVLTERNFLGGLDAGSCVDHTFCGLKESSLNGRPFRDWTPEERQEFATKYNVRWVWCRTASATDWWAMDPQAKLVKRSSGEGVLFQLNREASYVLSGQANLERADRRKIVLTDAVPNEQGELLLSFHFIPGMRVSPTVIKVEAQKDLFDPVPFIKLKLPGPVSRIVLTWENP